MKSIYFKKIITVVGIGLIIIVAGFIIFSQRIGQPPSGKEIGISQENINQGVVLIINDGSGELKSFQSQFQEGMTAFDLLGKITNESNLILKTKTYDIGVFIEAIGDKENGKDGKYWMYYLNDMLPMVASDKQELKPGDKVEFKFEISPF